MSKRQCWVVERKAKGARAWSFMWQATNEESPGDEWTDNFDGSKWRVVKYVPEAGK